MAYWRPGLTEVTWHSIMIWFRPTTLEDVRQRYGSVPSLATHLGIEMIALGPDFLTGRMPVDTRTQQPYGLLHGGASCVLAETVGSYAASLVIDREVARVVGLEINANHVRPATHGAVLGTARPLHLGKRTQVWDIRIESEASHELVCVSRLTIAVLRAR
jgi:1,4-dihydroxy-2-naphthoyl-CoA hydrolase